MEIVAQCGLGEAESRHSALENLLSARKWKLPPSAGAQRVSRAAPAAVDAKHAATECNGAVAAPCTSTTGVRRAVTALCTSTTGVRGAVTALCTSMIGVRGAVAALGTAMTGVRGAVTAPGTAMTGVRGAVAAPGTAMTGVRRAVTALGMAMTGVRGAVTALGTAVTGVRGAVAALGTAMTDVRRAVTAPRTRASAGVPVARRGGFLGVAGGLGGLAGSRRTAAASERLDAELLQLFRPGPEGRDEQLADADRQIVTVEPGCGEVLRRLLALRLEALAKGVELPAPRDRRPQLREMNLQPRYPGPLLRGRDEQTLPIEQRIGERDFGHGASLPPSSGVQKDGCGARSLKEKGEALAGDRAALHGAHTSSSRASGLRTHPRILPAGSPAARAGGGGSFPRGGRPRRGASGNRRGRRGGSRGNGRPEWRRKVPGAPPRGRSWRCDGGRRNRSGRRGDAGWRGRGGPRGERRCPPRSACARGAPAGGARELPPERRSRPGPRSGGPASPAARPPPLPPPGRRGRAAPQRATPAARRSTRRLPAGPATRP